MLKPIPIIKPYIYFLVWGEDQEASKVGVQLIRWDREVDEARTANHPALKREKDKMPLTLRRDGNRVYARVENVQRLIKGGVDSIHWGLFEKPHIIHLIRLSCIGNEVKRRFSKYLFELDNDEIELTEAL